VRGQTPKEKTSTPFLGDSEKGGNQRRKNRGFLSSDGEVDDVRFAPEDRGTQLWAKSREKKLSGRKIPSKIKRSKAKTQGTPTNARGREAPDTFKIATTIKRGSKGGS